MAPLLLIGLVLPPVHRLRVMTLPRVGYFVSARDENRRGYVNCASLYRTNAGDRLAQAAMALLRVRKTINGRSNVGGLDGWCSSSRGATDGA
jgi:hypothetical protein